ncbi:hypothetical protein E2C01_065939 [Portunus trituberculatus]|uniref:Uncharacterized protein n=1 Tax=Portunus trituberculatus TaxID=210409 RepID=A0A5B7HT72_PORTR|nr:hypothetical protein [Portunus trituberculatus]
MQKSLAYQFPVSRNLVCRIIPEVCQAIYQVLKPTYLKMPSTTEEWQQIASNYYWQWLFPMCLGALDVSSKQSYVPADMVDREDVHNLNFHQCQWHQHPPEALERLPLLARGHTREAKERRRWSLKTSIIVTSSVINSSCSTIFVKNDIPKVIYEDTFCHRDRRLFIYSTDIL